MRFILPLLLIIVFAIDVGFNMSHPLHLTPLSLYFQDSDPNLWKIIAIFSFGIALPLLVLIGSNLTMYSYKVLLLPLIIGVLDVIFINPNSILLIAAVTLILSKLVSDKVAIFMAISGVLFIFIPLLIVFYGSETFVDVQSYQVAHELYHTNHYIDYIVYNVTHFDYLMLLWLLLTVPLTKVTKHIRKFNITTTLLIAIMLFAIGTIFKTLLITLQSVPLLNMLLILSGTLQALALWLLFRTKWNVLILFDNLLVLRIILLFLFTSLGLGDYKNMSVEITLDYAFISIGIAIVLYFLEYFLIKKVLKHDNRTNFLYNEI